MNRLLLLTTLLSVCAFCLSALPGHNRYGGSPHGGNSLGHQGAVRYPAPPQAPRAPIHQSYGAPRGQYGARLSSPSASYNGGRHHNLPSPSVNHYSGPSGPSHYSAPLPYGGPASHAPIPSHYSSPKRSTYQQPQHHHQPSYSGPSARYGSAPQPQTYSHSHNTAESRSQTHGREMKYTVRDPQNKGTTHVSETHVVSNRQMHGAEAEAAMKKLMGNMGPGSDNGFQDLIKGMGLPFY